MTSEMSSRAIETIGAFVDYSVSERPIAPGHTLGNPKRPLLAREGMRQPAYWDGIPDLELVDVDRKGSPFPSGANQRRSGPKPSVVRCWSRPLVVATGRDATKIWCQATPARFLL